jgi:hypothetical protein
MRLGDPLQVLVHLTKWQAKQIGSLQRSCNQHCQTASIAGERENPRKIPLPFCDAGWRFDASCTRMQKARLLGPEDIPAAASELDILAVH